MIYDHVYARSLTLNILLTMLATATLAWFLPVWTPPDTTPKPTVPQVFFLPCGPHKSAEQAAVWSPAMIALPGLPARHRTGYQTGLPAPLLENPAIPPPPFDTSAAPGRAGAGRRLLMSATPETFRIQTPGIQPFPPITDVPGMDMYFDAGNPAFAMDHTQMDFTGIPAPDAPCVIVLFLCFDDAGAVRHVLLETPAPTPELNHALVRQAYRAVVKNPADAARPACARLYFSFN